METFGEYLRNQREKKGIRLEEIASITKIHLHSLQYLEKGSWSELPPEPFIRGFIIAYAKYVGLETREVLERYALEHGKSTPQQYDLTPLTSSPGSPAPVNNGPTTHQQKESPDQVLNTPRTLPLKKIGFATAGVLAFIILAILVSVGKETAEPKQNTVAKQEVQEPEKREVAAKTEQNSSSPAQAVPSPAQVVAEKPSTPPEFPHEISLETKEKSWAKIVIDDKAPVEFYTAPGKKTNYQAKHKIKLVLGNSAGSNVSYNGESVEGKKVMGTIRYFLFPQGARFPQDIPKRKEASTQPETPASPAETKPETPAEESKN